MPYETTRDLPAQVQDLPEHAKEIFLAAFNNALEQYKDRENPEEVAFKVAWAAVEKTYKKDADGKWVKLTDIRYLTTVTLDEGSDVGIHQALRPGTFYHPIYGQFTVTPEMLKMMVENYKEHRPQAPTELVVDYEHQSGKSDKAPAAGWIKNLAITNNNLFMTVEWTKAAAQAIRDKEYRYISPEFTFHYTAKDTGKDVGPTLLSAALTNRPFVEGMQPVVLQDTLEAVVRLSEGAIAFADWDTAYINDLPDSSFAIIKPGGEKDESGRTVPRELRMLPFKDKDGEVDKPHLRNALARVEQPDTDLTPEQRAEARRVLEAAARGADVGEHDKTEDKGMQLTEQEYKGLKAQADSAAGLQIQLTEVTKERDTAVQALAEVNKIILGKEADAKVAELIANKKLLPKQAEWAKSLYLSDKGQFDAFVKVAPEIGPDMTVRGHEKEGEGSAEADKIELTETEKNLGVRFGLSEERLIEQKKRDLARAKENK